MISSYEVVLYYTVLRRKEKGYGLNTTSGLLKKIIIIKVF